MTISPLVPSALVLSLAAGGLLFAGSERAGEYRRGPSTGAVDAEEAFAIVTHSPWVEQGDVSTDRPEVRITFSRPYDPLSVDDGTVVLGWFDTEDQLHPVPIRVARSEGGRTLSLIPLVPLDGAVYHGVIVRGGAGGVAGVGGSTLAEDYTWRFSTLPDFAVGRAGGASTTVHLGDRERGPSARGHGARMVSTSLTLSREGQEVQRECDRTDPDEWGQRPSVDILVYQTVCNGRLIPGKPAIIRIYLNWTYPEGKKGVDEYYMGVDLFWEIQGGRLRPIGWEPKRFQREYTADEMKRAENSLNVLWTPDDDVIGDVTVSALVTLYRSHKLQNGRNIASQPRDLETMLRKVSFEFPVVMAAVGEWKDGLPTRTVTLSDGSQKTLGPVQDWDRRIEWGTRFAVQNLPITDATPNFNSTPIAWEDEPECRPSRADCERYLVDGDEVPADEWLAQTLTKHLTPPEGKPPHLIVAVVPESFGGDDWVGHNLREKSSVESVATALCPICPEVRTRTPSVILMKNEGAGIATVAHELGHYLGLFHDPLDAEALSDGIEGFRITPSDRFNKSIIEGNEQSQQLVSLMRAGGRDNGEASSFILNQQYHDLAVDLEQEELFPWSLGATPVAGWQRWAPGLRAGTSSAERGPAAPSATSVRAVPPVLQADGSHLLVSGYLHPDGNSATLNRAMTVDSTPPAHVDGDYRLRVGGPDGSVLAEASFGVTAEIEVDGEPATRSLIPFRVGVPHPGPVASVQLLDGFGSTIAERSAGPTPPEARFRSEGDAVWSANGAIRWEGSDPDGDSVSFSVYYRPGPTDAWRVLAKDVADVEVTPDPAMLPPGEEPVLRLVASDGLNSVSVDSENVEPAPVVTWTMPLADTTASVGTVIQVRATAPFDSASVAQAVELVSPDGSPVKGALRMTNGSRGFEFRPAAPLRPGTAYTVRVGELASTYGGRLAAQSWSFFTEPDTVPPEAVASWPRDGALAIPLASAIELAFSETVDQESLDRGITVASAEGEAVDGTVSFDDATLTATWVPGHPLSPDTDYVVTVTTDVRDRAGNAVSAGLQSGFRTAGAVGPLPPGM